MIHIAKYLLLIILMSGFYSEKSASVQISHNGLGEVLVYPYYTVNNDLNTLYSIVNTTDQPKAISVRFQEGEFGYDVLSYHIYLDAYDVWAGALVATESTIAGHVGESSVVHLTSDDSCAPFLVKEGQEFLPFMIDLDPTFNNDMSRSREGQLKVIEMGVLTGEAADAVNQNNVGHDGCVSILADWADNGVWDLDDLAEPTGGLMGSATLVNVAEGLALSYDATALQNFWEEGGVHTEPGSPEPNLSSAFPQSSVQLDNGELEVAEWENGYEAVSAVFMSTYIYNEYVLDSVINGQSEWVLSFPTKKYHTMPGSSVTPPLTVNWNGLASCHEYEQSIYDREEQLEVLTVGGVTRPPPPPSPALCFSSNVVEFQLPGEQTIRLSSEILGSKNNTGYTSPANAVIESGWAVFSFTDFSYRMTPSNDASVVLGLPVTGFAVQQFTNAGAAEGLLAQYGSLFMHKSKLTAEE